MTQPLGYGIIVFVLSLITLCFGFGTLLGITDSHSDKSVENLAVLAITFSLLLGIGVFLMLSK